VQHSSSLSSDGPLVSVIIPTYNRRALLKESIESVLAQSYQNLELIVVDDGSTDGTDELVRANWPAIRYVWQPNAGDAAARNRGLDLVRGELIAFQDSDDLWQPEKLALQVALLRDRAEVGVVCASRRLMDERGKISPKRWRLTHSGWVTEAMFRSMFVIMPSTVVRRSVVDCVGRFSTDLTVTSDYEYWLRASLVTQFAAVDRELVVERKSPCRLTSARGRGMTLQYHMLRRFYEQLGGRAVIPARAANRALGKWAYRAGRDLRREGRFDAAEEMLAESLAYHFTPRVAALRWWVQCRRLFPAFGRQHPLDFPWPVRLSPMPQAK
jgi:glycosyltransferase involved in cell wall biosynthesis